LLLLQRERNLLFLKKKKQKDFCSFFSVTGMLRFDPWSDASYWNARLGFDMKVNHLEIGGKGRSRRRMGSRMMLQGRTAVITGAGSGIGRALAITLARRGCHLALADINDEGLRETVRQIGDAVRVSHHRLDVSDPAQIAAFPDLVKETHADLDLLINNAGVALGGTFEDVAAEDFDWLFSINFFGVVRMTRAFLPALKMSGDARLVNLSSIYGIIAPPGQTAYAASKFAVRGFSEALRHELSNSRVGVTVVHPGGVATNIARNARAPKGAPPEEFKRRVQAIEARLTLSPAIAAETIVSAVERRRPRVLVGMDAKLVAIAERIAPQSHMSLLRRGLG
jgi:short-subunit dehydrogenase